MKVKKPVKGYKIIDLGPLDSFQRMPVVSERIRSIPSFVCATCRKPVGDKPWILGYKKHNIKGIPHAFRLHEDCWDQTGKEVKKQ